MTTHLDKMVTQKTYYPSFKNTLLWLKIKDIITYTILMISYKSYYTRLASEHHQLIRPPGYRIILTLFLNVPSFMLLQANETKEHIRSSNLDCFNNSV